MTLSSSLEQAAGALLMLVGSADLFVTVLYARIGSQVGSRMGMGFGRLIAPAVWAGAVAVSRRFNKREAVLLSAAAPATLLLMLAFWSTLLTLGAALVVHPELGSGIQRSSGGTPTDFASALYAAGSSLSIVSNSDFSPQTAPMRLAVLGNALLGTSMLTLTITYLMQIYRAVQTRNALGLKIQSMSGGVSQAAELLGRWGPLGRFEIGYASMAEVAGELAEVHEAHHLYPLLFYFRFDTPYPNPALYLPVLLEAAALIHSALPEGDDAWLRRSAAAEELWHGSLDLLELLERVFVPGEGRPHHGLERPALDDRFRRSLEVLRRCGVRTVDDTAAADCYAQRLGEWQDKAHRLAAYLQHRAEEVLVAPRA